MEKKVYALMVGDMYNADYYVLCVFGSDKALCEYIEEMREKGSITGFEHDNKDLFSVSRGLGFRSYGKLWIGVGISEDIWIDILTYRE